MTGEVANRWGKDKCGLRCVHTHAAYVHAFSCSSCVLATRSECNCCCCNLNLQSCACVFSAAMQFDAGTDGILAVQSGALYTTPVCFGEAGRGNAAP